MALSVEVTTVQLDSIKSTFTFTFNFTFTYTLPLPKAVCLRVSMCVQIKSQSV